MQQKIAIIFVVVFAAISGANCDLTSASVYDGPCPAAYPTAQNADLIWTHLPRKYYLPLATEHCYRNLFEMFNGRSASSAAELQTMNPMAAWGAQTSTFTGSGQTSTFACVENSLTTLEVECTPVSTTSLASLLPIQFVTATAILTDNKSYVMVGGCLNITNGDQTTGTREFAVFSINPTLSAAAFSAVLKEANALGFNPAYNQNYTYPAGSAPTDTISISLPVAL